jgi:hypothetical protein
MTTVSAGRSTRSQRRVHPAVGTAAAAMVAVATVGVGAQFIGVTPPAGDISRYCVGAYQCLRPGADRLLPDGLDSLVPYGPAMWNSGMPSGQVASTHTAAPSDPMLAPADASKPPQPRFQPTSHVAMSPK